MTRRPLVLLVALAAVLAACGEEPALTVQLSENLLPVESARAPVQNRGGWIFGFDRRLEPKEDVRINASLLNWLSSETGFTFQLRTTPDSGSIVNELCSGQIHFAIVGTVSYLQASERCDVRILVRGLNTEGADTYRAALVTGQGAFIEEVIDLRGRTFAFGAPNSTQGHLIPRLVLEQAGISLTDLGAYTFTSSHAATARAVTNGSFDAGGLQDTLAFELAGRGLVHILALSDPYPSSGIVVGPEVPAKTAEIVRDALLTLDPTGADTGVLYHWDRSEMPHGFVEAQDADYETLRGLAREVGLLEP